MTIRPPIRQNEKTLKLLALRLLVREKQLKRK
jgi:hypothetical protein